MILFFSLLPLYIFGNLHCLSMCGPLVMLLGKHPWPHYYFLGRLFSYGLAAFLAALLGAILYLILKEYHLSEAISITCGVAMMSYGIHKICGTKIFLSRKTRTASLQWITRKISSLLLHETKGAAFLFGALTVLLPCGQTLFVFSACALSANPLSGLFNGIAFALFTTPSLALSMRALTLFKGLKNFECYTTGSCAIIAGLFSLLRGLAEGGWMEHLVLNPSSDPKYHLVIYTTLLGIE